MTNAVLLAEPEPETREFLSRHLADDGFRVLGAERDGEVLDLAERARPDLVLLAEVELCRRLREGEPGRSWDRRVPVIVLAPGAGDPIDRVRAFDRGADDVVDRPFHYEELLARIHAVLRRASPPPEERIEAGEIVVDLAARTAFYAGRRLELSGRELALLAKLAAEPTRVFTKDQLLRDVWGYQRLGRTRTLDSHASRLRRKLREAGGDGFVVNAWGVGYRLRDP